MATSVGLSGNAAVLPHEFVEPMFPAEEGLAGRVDTHVTPLALKVVMVVLFAFLAILMLMTTVYQCCFAATPEANGGGAGASGAGSGSGTGGANGPHEMKQLVQNEGSSEAAGSVKNEGSSEAGESDKASESGGSVKNEGSSEADQTSDAGEAGEGTDLKTVADPATFNQEAPRAESPNGELESDEEAS